MYVVSSISLVFLANFESPLKIIFLAKLNGLIGIWQVFTIAFERNQVNHMSSSAWLM